MVKPGTNTSRNYYKASLGIEFDTCHSFDFRCPFHGEFLLFLQGSIEFAMGSKILPWLIFSAGCFHGSPGVPGVVDDSVKVKMMKMKVG